MDQNTNQALSDLLNDPAKLQSALNAATSLLGGSQSPAPPQRPMQPQGAQAAAGIQPPPMMSGGGGRTSTAYDPSADLMRKVMPVINTIARSGQQAVNRDRANLLQSFKPFVTDNVGSQFDHAIRLVSIARMAKNTMLQLGSNQSISSDGTKSL